MKNYLIIAFLFGMVCLSCRKPIEPLDFNSNPIDPASGVVLKMVEIDSITASTNINGPYQIVYFHLNFDQLPKKFGTAKRIDIYRDREYLYFRNVNFTANTYYFYVYGGSENSELGFIIISTDDKETDMQFPPRP